MNGFDFGWFLGVLKAWTSISLSSCKCGTVSNDLSNESSGLLYLRQLPVSFNSSIVWIFWTANLALGPLGDFKSHIKKSVFFLDSKYMQLLHDREKHRSLMQSFAIVLSILFSFLEWGNKSSMSVIKCLNREFTPRAHITRVRCRFFQSLELGSGSLNALSSFS